MPRSTSYMDQTYKRCVQGEMTTMTLGNGPEQSCEEHGISHPFPELPETTRIAHPPGAVSEGCEFHCDESDCAFERSRAVIEKIVEQRPNFNPRKDETLLGWAAKR